VWSFVYHNDGTIETAREQDAADNPRGMKYKETGANSIMRRFITHALHHT
jgi:hypothetical protein